MTITDEAYRKARKKSRKRPAKYSESLKKELLAEHKRYGGTQRELAVAYGVSQPTVFKWLQEAGR